MYLDFYGFAEPPFSTTPDPKFLYRTAGHHEALAHLIYGVQDDKGFTMLTGAIGTGKTTLLHALLRALAPEVGVAFVSNSMLRFEGLVEYIVQEFGIAKPTDSHVQQLIALRNHLLERDRAGRKTVLILDDAHNFSPATLERVRLLSSFERPGAKLLQILLVGQPELATKLRRPELRQLQQRIALRFQIEPLSAEDTRAYIRTRLRIARAEDPGLFTARAVSRIHLYSGGIPRVVNLLCDRCLLIGYADQRRRIEPAVVEEARAQLLDVRSRRQFPKIARGLNARLRPWAVGALAAAIVIGLGAFVLRPEAGHLAEVARSALDLLIR